MGFSDKLKEIGSKIVRKIDLKPGLQRIRDSISRFVPKPWKPTKPIQLAPAVIKPYTLPVLKAPPKIEAKPYFNPNHPTLK